MPSDRFNLIHNIVLILAETTRTLSRRCQRFLYFLSEQYSLKYAALLLFDDRGRRIAQIHHTDQTPDDLRQLNVVAKSDWARALNAEAPVRINGNLVVTIQTSRRRLGLLVLGNPPKNFHAGRRRQELSAIASSLALLFDGQREAGRLKQQGAVRQALVALALLLNRAESLSHLQWIAGRTMIRYGGICCAVLRPIHGHTLVDSPQVFSRPQQHLLEPLMVELEELFAQRAIDTRQPVFAQRKIRNPKTGERLTYRIVSQVLATHDCDHGTLTLFSQIARSPGVLSLDTADRATLELFQSLLAHAFERVATRDQLTHLSRISAQRVAEISLLYRIAKALHSTLRLDELTHLILSVAATPAGGGFERAMLFTVNERTGVLQGMLGIDAPSAELVLQGEDGELRWEAPYLQHSIIEAQRATDLNRQVVKQRLALDSTDNALARAYRYRRVILVPRPEQEAAGGRALAKRLRLGPYACVPLPGRDQTMGLLLVDNPSSGAPVTAEHMRFLELFMNQAGAALENAKLVHHLEQTHEDLREVQERLIQGEKLAVLGEMAAQVAHELKNPLVSIGGFAQRLARQDLGDERSNQYATIIAREVRRMEEMLGNILAFSKKQLVCLEPCLLVDVVHEVMDLERDNQRRTDIDVIAEIQEQMPTLIGDCSQLRQVILNLFVNARQAMPNGGTLYVRAGRCRLRGEEALRFEVEDTGGGITPDIIRNIFNPFFSTQAKGTGLGLSISHRIIEQHHGEIEVVNGERGACFIVRLPLAPPGPAAR